MKNTPIIIRFTVAALCACVAVSFAHAEPVTLKVSEIDLLAGAIQALDLVEREVPQGDQPARIVKGISVTGLVRSALQDDLAVLNAVIKPYLEVKKGIILEISGGASEILPPKPPGNPADADGWKKYDAAKADFDKKRAAFDAKHEPVYAKPYTVELTKIKRTELLNGSINSGIPTSLLEALTPILTK